MIWYIVSALMLTVAVALLVYSRIRDRRYLKANMQNTMGEEVKQELEDELAAAKSRQQKFEEALKKAQEH